jgi:hypothetical protein
MLRSQFEFPATVAQTSSLLLRFSFARTFVPWGSVWKLIVLLKLLESFSVEEFE